MNRWKPVQDGCLHLYPPLRKLQQTEQRRQGTRCRRPSCKAAPRSPPCAQSASIPPLPCTCSHPLAVAWLHARAPPRAASSLSRAAAGQQRAALRSKPLGGPAARRGPARVPPLHDGRPSGVPHTGAAAARRAAAAGKLAGSWRDGPAQKEPKAFLEPEPAGITRSTLKRTVLDSGLRGWAGVRAGVGGRSAAVAAGASAARRGVPSWTAAADAAAAAMGGDREAALRRQRFRGSASFSVWRRRERAGQRTAGAWSAAAPPAALQPAQNCGLHMRGCACSPAQPSRSPSLHLTHRHRPTTTASPPPQTNTTTRHKRLVDALTNKGAPALADDHGVALVAAEAGRDVGRDVGVALLVALRVARVGGRAGGRRRGQRRRRCKQQRGRGGHGPAASRSRKAGWPQAVGAWLATRTNSARSRPTAPRAHQCTISRRGAHLVLLDEVQVVAAHHDRAVHLGALHLRRRRAAGSDRGRGAGRQELRRCG